jgi:signal transduction histidine kinase
MTLCDHQPEPRCCDDITLLHHCVRLDRLRPYLASDAVLRGGRQHANRVLLSVKDAGIGFDPQTVDRLFETFYTTKNNSMGVGLCVSRSIIESHQGRLWAKLNDGPGATFLFSIPRGLDGATGADRDRDMQSPAGAYTDSL